MKIAMCMVAMFSVLGLAACEKQTVPPAPSKTEVNAWDKALGNSYTTSKLLRKKTASGESSKLLRKKTASSE